MTFHARVKQIYKIAGTTKMYYHGSEKLLPLNTTLKPQNNLNSIPNLKILEKYRPDGMLSLTKAVFLADNWDDIDALGGATDYIFTVVPQGKVERHNLGWSTELSGLEPSDPNFVTKEKKFAENYWKGISHPEGVWEYLTAAATIVGIDEE